MINNLGLASTTQLKSAFLAYSIRFALRLGAELQVIIAAKRQITFWLVTARVRTISLLPIFNMRFLVKPCASCITTFVFVHYLVVIATITLDGGAD
jgi:hypothetical protein